MRILVTGATGYIGGRLIPALLDEGHTVVAGARDINALRDQPWVSRVQVVRADVLDPASLQEALSGVDAAYYLVHALAGRGDFEEIDRRGARNFAIAARAQGVGRLIYLGGLLPDDDDVSKHLRSRAEVGEILLGSGVPTIVLRAAVIIGSGSASFEMLRYLTERLPVMLTPRWVDSRVQPIAVRDVLWYLVGSLRIPADVSRAFDIGGPDVLTYRMMMQRFAEAEGLPRRRILGTRFLSPGLSSHWVQIITPVPNSIARPLIEGLRNTVVCQDKDIESYVPDPEGGLTGYEDSVRLALTRISKGEVPTRWSSAEYPGAPSDPLPSDPDWAGGNLFVDERARVVSASPEDLWSVIASIGGHNGWYSWSLAWRVRGLMDRLSGGPGIRRGRRHPTELYQGEALDFWRVEEVREGELLRLRAEMRLPGLAWLDLGVTRGQHGETIYTQRATFYPKGLAGQAYWYSVLPFHGVVFGGMQRNIADAAEALASDESPPTVPPL